MILSIKNMEFAIGNYLKIKLKSEIPISNSITFCIVFYKVRVYKTLKAR